MTATRPEAKTEYSSVGGGLRAVARAFSTPGGVVAAGAILGAVILLAAELLPLYSLHIITTRAPAGSTATGPHDAWALVPIAALAIALALGPVRRLQVPGLASLAALSAIVLVIAVAADLPDSRAHGLIHGTLLAATTPEAGLYAETLGGVVLALVAGTGLAATRIRAARGSRRRRRAPQRVARPRRDADSP